MNLKQAAKKFFGPPHSDEAQWGKYVGLGMGLVFCGILLAAVVATTPLQVGIGIGVVIVGFVMCQVFDTKLTKAAKARQEPNGQPLNADVGQA